MDPCFDSVMFTMNLILLLRRGVLQTLAEGLCRPARNKSIIHLLVVQPSLLRTKVNKLDQRAARIGLDLDLGLLGARMHDLERLAIVEFVRNALSDLKVREPLSLDVQCSISELVDGRVRERVGEEVGDVFTRGPADGRVTTADDRDLFVWNVEAKEPANRTSVRGKTQVRIIMPNARDNEPIREQADIVQRVRELEGAKLCMHIDLACHIFHRRIEAFVGEIFCPHTELPVNVHEHNFILNVRSKNLRGHKVLHACLFRGICQSRLEEDPSAAERRDDNFGTCLAEDTLQLGRVGIIDDSYGGALGDIHRLAAEHDDARALLNQGGGDIGSETASAASDSELREGESSGRHCELELRAENL